MAAIHYVTNPETKKVISLSTKSVKQLQISTDINPATAYRSISGMPLSGRLSTITRVY